MAITSIPLTTTFTPPPDCLASLTYLSTQLHLGADPSCLPSGAALYGQTQVFSPAWICPWGWTSASGTVASAGTVTETKAVCCPVVPDQLTSADSDMNVQSDGQDYLLCTARVTGPFPELYVSSGRTFSSMAYAHSTDTTTFLASVIQIAWQASDTMKPSTSITSASSSRPPSSTVPAVVTATSAAPTPDSNPSGGLSKPAKIAIGVVIPVLVIGLIALVVFIIRRRRAKKEPTREIQQEIMQDGPVDTMMSTRPATIENEKMVSARTSYVPFQQEDYHSTAGISSRAD